MSLVFASGLMKHTEKDLEKAGTFLFIAGDIGLLGIGFQASTRRFQAYSTVAFFVLELISQQLISEAINA